MIFQNKNSIVKELLFFINFFIITISICIALLLFFKLQKKDLGKKIISMLGLSLIETLLFGVLMFSLERLNLLWMRVIVYDSEFLLSAELGLTFYLFFLLISFITELMGYNISILKKRHSKVRKLPNIIKTAGVLSVIQTILLLSLEFALEIGGIFGIALFTQDNQEISLISFVFVIFALIFISELIIELINKKSQIIVISETI